MPGFDGTGPRGMGPMTGRGMGPCGGGYGYGRGVRYGASYPSRITKKEEREILENELDAIQEEMNDVKSRLDELKGE